ncbi:MAG: hypothetical protein BWY49_00260 [Candidatus Omnitrophica bacterium ADurb.Bin314]|nr:MAG: hypothetical protein BWY49_00260 [Candidatus Omnitrophica bacterium ADurb.Bin314]
MGSEVEPGSLVSLLSRASNVCAWNSAGRRTESFGRNIRRHTLFWDELRDILEAGPCGPSRPLGNRNIFLDFEYRHLLYYPKIMHLLDKWVLMLKPTSESLTEGYKMLKAGLALNPHLECFILLQAKADPPVGSTLFERFAALASKHLQIHPGWLGWLDLSDRDHFFEPKLNVEQLHFRPARAWTSPERLTLVDWVESAERGAGEVAP